MNKNFIKKSIIVLVLLSLFGLTACNGKNEIDLEAVQIEEGIYVEDADSKTIDFQLDDGNILSLETLEEDSLGDLKNGVAYSFTYDSKNDILIALKENIEENKIDEEKSENPIKLTSHVDLEGFNLVESVKWDITGDGKEDEISLYTTAEVDSDGQLALDDGQEWALIVSTSRGEYEIFKDFIQIGSLDFYAYTIDDDFFITTVQSGTANLKITEFKFENEEFLPSVNYNPGGNINMIYSN